MNKNIALTLIASTMALGGCSNTPLSKPAASDSGAITPPDLSDGDLKVPENYRNWPVFLSGIDKVDAQQVRDIYINPVGHATKEGSAFPHGTLSVMEIWNPKTLSDGSLAMTSDGALIKEDLKLIFLMGKSKDAGTGIAPELRNGDWVYAGYQADGITPGGPGADACRSCHMSQADNDWVFRADEYYATRQ